MNRQKRRKIENQEVATYMIFNPFIDRVVK